MLLFLLVLCVFCGVSIQAAKSSKKSPQRVQEKATPSDSLLTWMSNLKTQSQMYRDSGEVQMAILLLSKVVDERWRDPESAEEFEKLAWIYTNRAYLYHEQQGDFLSAKEDYLSALKQFEQCSPSDYLVARYVYQPLGNIYTRLGENEIAISMLEKFKQVCEENRETEALMNAYNDIGRAYMNSGELETSVDFFQKGIEIDPKDQFNAGLLYSSKAEAEEKSGLLEESMKSAELSIRCLNEVLRSADPTDYHYDAAKRYKIGVLATKAKVLGHLGEKAKAHENYQASHDLAMEVYPKKHRALARTFVELGNSWAALGEGVKAMENYQMGLNAIVEGIKIEDYAKNPSKKVLFADVVIGEALVQKAQVAHDLFEKQNGKQWLEVSAKAFMAYFDWVEVQRSEQFEFNSKLGAASEIHRIGESALQTFYDLYKEHGNTHWIDTAFTLMDQTKAIVLAEERGFKELADSNPKMRSLLKEQNILKYQRTLFKADMRAAEEKGDTKEVQRLKKRVSDLDKQSQLLEQEIRSLFPAYRMQASSRLEGEVEARLKQKLKSRNAEVLSYFVGNKWAYAIIGRPGEFQFVRIPQQELMDEVVSFITELNNPVNANPRDLEREGKQLFDVLIPKGTKGENWVVLPDGFLNGLPFEALISYYSANPSFKSLNYVLNDHVVQYAPSAYFFAQDQFGKRAAASFLGIAPVFEHSSTYAYLPKSLEELQTGVKQFAGKELTGNDATKRYFFKEAEEYDILHVSTHAGSNSGENNDAWMIFSDAASKDHKLVANELLQLDLPASLVVLNACETGRGTVFQGEGPMSLARGFLDAGSQSTITNLWSVSHASNAVIMKYFYEDLSKNQSPSKALTQAKLSYLASSEIDDASAHPFYWSSAILVGTDVAVNEPPASYFWLWMIIGALGLIFIGGSIYAKRRKTTV